MIAESGLERPQLNLLDNGGLNLLPVGLTGSPCLDGFMIFPTGSTSHLSIGERKIYSDPNYNYDCTIRVGTPAQLNFGGKRVEGQAYM